MRGFAGSVVCLGFWPVPLAAFSTGIIEHGGTHAVLFRCLPNRILHIVDHVARTAFQNSCHRWSALRGWHTAPAEVGADCHGQTRGEAKDLGVGMSFARDRANTERLISVATPDFRKGGDTKAELATYFISQASM